MDHYSNTFISQRFLPVVIGSFVALCSALILRLPYIWAALVTVGLAVCILSLIARDFKLYWLAIFALTLPLEIKKMLIDSGYVQDFVLRYGFPVGELPGPVLYLSDIPFAILLAQWFIEIKNGKRKINFPKSNIFALALLAWSGLSLLNAPNFSSGFFELMRMSKLYVLYLYISNNVSSKETLKTLVAFFFIGVMLQGLLCLFQFLIQSKGFLLSGIFAKQSFFSEDLTKKMGSVFSVSETGADMVRASGTAGASNAEAQFFEFLLPVAFALWLSTRGLSGSLFNLAALSLGLAGFIVTFSRGGLVGITVGLVFTLILAKSTRLASNRQFMTLLLTGLLVCVLITPKIYSYLMTRPESTSARFHLNKVGLEMIKAHPFIGVGLNNHLILKPEFDPKSYVFPMPTHNHYILLASQTGIPGTVFFTGFLISTLLLSLKAAGRKDLYSASVAVGIFGGITAVAVHVMADYIGTHTNMTMLWMYGGLAAALSKME